MIGFGAAVPQPARSHAYASQTPSLGSAQGLLLTRVGSPLARQDSHLLDDRQSFMEASHPPFPFDQPCLVARTCLSVPDLPEDLLAFTAVLPQAALHQALGIAERKPLANVLDIADYKTPATCEAEHIPSHSLR